MAAEGILKIISDTTLRSRMSVNSLKIAKTHDIVHTLEQFEELYNMVIEQKKVDLKETEQYGLSE
jgi:hypothetical protein